MEFISGKNLGITQEIESQMAERSTVSIETQDGPRKDQNAHRAESDNQMTAQENTTTQKKVSCNSVIVSAAITPTSGLRGPVIPS